MRIKILVPATYVFKNFEIKRLLKLAPADVENLNVAAFREIVADVTLLSSKGVKSVVVLFNLVTVHSLHIFILS
jgi:hypothetical protein